VIFWFQAFAFPKCNLCRYTAGAARVVLRDANTRASVGVVWLVDPTPGRAVTVAFSPAEEDDDLDADADAAAGRRIPGVVGLCTLNQVDP
jgi:hypothetical protein